MPRHSVAERSRIAFSMKILHAGSILHSVASPFYSFVTSLV